MAADKFRRSRPPFTDSLVRISNLIALFAFLYLCERSLSFVPNQNNRVGPRQSFPLLATPERVSTTKITEPSTDEVSNTVKEFQGIRRNVINFLREDDHHGAKEMIRGMIEYLHEANDDVSSDVRMLLSEVVDEAFQSFFVSTFSPPYRGKGARKRVSIGTSGLKLQLSSNVLDSPYNQIPRRTFLSAVKALTGVNESRNSKDSLSNTDTAFRLLQRLVTGVGVRSGGNVDCPTKLYESDFNLVLNAYSNLGRMDMAHRVVALQERTPHAPSLSPVTYSILLKGYGRLRDLNNVEMLLNHAQACGVEPDVIMFNSLIDAYVNCDELVLAQKIFETMKKPELASELVPDCEALFIENSCPFPNRRTFNIIMKGLAKKGRLDDAVCLSNEMQDKNIWDHVTTNTLVQAAVNAGDFAFAERILEEQTEKPRKKGRHQNAEAYTTLIDGYAKHGDIKKGVELLKCMRDRSVEPNEFTYTCLIGALARNKKLEQAKKLMEVMEMSGLKVKTVTYNSLISGILYRQTETDGESFDSFVDESISVLRQMMARGVRPNAVTVSVIIGAFGKCDRPRAIEAVSLIEKLNSDGVISGSNVKIATSLIQVQGADQNLAGVLETFRSIKQPDVAAINALLNASFQCNNEAVAMKSFRHYFKNDQSTRHRPDVKSYSTIVAFFLRKNSPEGTIAARDLYEEMKYERRIMPDNALVDM
jgi:pentatricopeptide repeat protein